MCSINAILSVCIIKMRHAANYVSVIWYPAFVVMPLVALRLISKDTGINQAVGIPDM